MSLKILEETDFIDLVSCSGWSMALNERQFSKEYKNILIISFVSLLIIYWLVFYLTKW